MRGRFIVIAVAAAAVAIAAIASLGGGGSSDKGGKGSSGQRAPKGDLALRFAYSPEKAPLMRPLIRDFNAKGVTVGGRRVFVETVDKVDGGGYNSGDAEHALATGSSPRRTAGPSSTGSTSCEREGTTCRNATATSL